MKNWTRGLGDQGTSGPSPRLPVSPSLPPRRRCQREALRRGSPRPPIPPSPRHPVSQSPLACPRVGVASAKRLGGGLPISPHLIFVTLMLLCLSGVVVAEILPASQLFEGNIIAQNVSFRYAGTEPQPLLRDVLPLEEISITGRQTVTLVGAFASSAQPGLAAVTNITVELWDDSSNLTLKPLGTARDLQLKDVLLREGTAVVDLSYRAPENRLSLHLQPQFRPNLLAINLGSQPLQVSLKGYRIVDGVNMQEKAVNNELNFTFTPASELLSLSLPEVAKLSMILPDIDQNSQWFGENLNVADLGFAGGDSQRLALNSGYGGNNSTILSGEVRMGGKAMKLGKNQFFMAGTPGIEKVRYWQIDEGNSAIALRVTGKSTVVAAGLDPDFPVERIKVSYLRLWLPETAVAALIPITTALVSYLLYWLLEHRPVWRQLRR
ncbi:hypothetical protein [[Phormidium] sp. ETS-05]|uniref:hypothetical protein n=1 Tax=[Phormidium] sp. ETS-05 TaxID=222819 RepID=UPI0018EF2C75|nr:hypothetical protein [[Phormidium] sp. ETS-05]